MIEAAEGTIAGRVAVVQAAIAAACARAKRPIESVTLIAVSKTHPPAPIIEAAAAGIRHFGENRVEEAGKIAAVDAAQTDLTWHMIGHVQSRKARDVIDHFTWIHSLDSAKLAERYSRLAVEQNVTLHTLLEINISGEASKEGLNASQWENDAVQRESLWNEIRRMINLPNLTLRGLMTIAPIADDPEAVRPVFARLRHLRDALANDFPAARWDTLSMGMTDDYPVAIEEGATFVRVGRAIFGAREAVAKP